MYETHSLIGMLVVGIVVGWLASVMVQGRGMGIIPDMVVGILGAFVGTFLADKLHIHVADGLGGLLIVSIFGAVVLLVVIRLVKPAR